MHCCSRLRVKHVKSETLQSQVIPDSYGSHGLCNHEWSFESCHMPKRLAGTAVLACAWCQAARHHACKIASRRQGLASLVALLACIAHHYACVSSPHSRAIAGGRTLLHVAPSAKAAPERQPRASGGRAGRHAPGKVLTGAVASVHPTHLDVTLDSGALLRHSHLAPACVSSCLLSRFEHAEHLLTVKVAQLLRPIGAVACAVNK